MKKLVLVALALAAFLAFSLAAKANSFDYTFAGVNDLNLTGGFSYNLNNSNSLVGAPLSLASSSEAYFPFGTYTFTPTGSYYVNSTVAGLFFTDGSYTVELFDSGTGWQLEEVVSGQGQNNTDQLLTANASPVPEPSSLLLLGTGLFLLAAVILWKSGRRRSLPSSRT